MIVAVGSTNPTKIKPVKEIFSEHFPDVEVIGVSISSGVSNQPMSDDEVFQGALTRAKTALEIVKDAQFGVGIEAGMNQHNYGWLERSLVVILDRHDCMGIGASGGLVVPDGFVKKINLGQELEQVIDDVFGTKNIGEGVGMNGLMTKGSVDRTQTINHAVAFALARHLHKNLYEEKSDPSEKI